MNYPDGMTRRDWYNVGELDMCEHGSYLGQNSRGCRECYERDPDDARDERDERPEHEQ